jgi:hypothetical protein
MYFELSLPLLWLVAFVVLSFPDIYNIVKDSLKKPKLSLLIGVISFPVFATLSILWSSNQLRGLLTAGVIWCLTLALLTIPKIMTKKKTKNKFVKIALISAVTFSVLCWIQCILDVFGVGREVTQLCPGCTYKALGFPHPNGFTIESQFMGSLLLAPIILLCNSLLYNNSKKSQIHSITALFIIISTLFLTLSRGAIFAFVIMMAIIIVRFFKDKRYILKLAFTSAFAFVFTLNMQGLFTALSPTNETYYDGVAKVIHQLSLGKIDIRDDKTIDTANGETISEPPVNAGFSTEVDNLGSANSEASDQSTSDEVLFDGYIAESTNRRLELSKMALDIWNDEPENIFVGTGLGSAGTEMLKKNPAQGTAKEIVQNQYLELLLETGIVGVLLATVSICAYIKFQKNKFEFFTLALVIAFAFTLLFFSGLPNALHIYLLPVIWYNLLYGSSKNRISRIQK